jgi:hypothetical protein
MERVDLEDVGVVQGNGALDGGIKVASEGNTCYGWRTDIIGK